MSFQLRLDALETRENPVGPTPIDPTYAASEISSGLYNPNDTTYDPNAGVIYVPIDSSIDLVSQNPLTQMEFPGTWLYPDPGTMPQP